MDRLLHPAPIDPAVLEALSLIETSSLPHPSGPLLHSFVTTALNPIVAAQYITERWALGEVTLPVEDWRYIVESISHNGTAPPAPSDAEREMITKRDGNRCCLTGRPTSRHGPLVVVPILPVPSGWVTDRPGIHDMLGAYFGAPYRDWWLSYAKDPAAMPRTSNHWLLQRSASKVYEQGLVFLARILPFRTEFQVMPNFIVNPMTPRIKPDGVYPLLGDHSRRNVGKVDYRFIGSHALFSMSVQFLDIQKEWSLPAPKAASEPSFLATAVLPLKSILGLISNPLLAAWLTAPDRVRAATYSLLKRVGRWVYGRQFEARVQRLPFRLYLKEHSSVRAGNNEFNALRLVHKYTTTSPAPTAIDMVLLPASDKCYVLSTRLPGLPLSRCVYALSDQDLNHVATQLKDYLAQLRSIPGPANTEAPISNTAGEAIMDTRIKEGTPVGPFADEASFSQLLGFPDDPARRGHKVVFTHADMNPRNIMVDRSVRPDSTLGWSLSGIVDWESAGYYPEYWEYTKALWEVHPTFERPHAMMHEVFRALGDYSAELDVESRSRELW